ncbi:MAG TPA: bifunctional aldolase/short-chain dehydrogenase [Pseudolabrys sp.]|jgi:rhamnose utilization protein RhaD (predicted bifunctional aldolase and dehydrogenase)/NAD(P)-dependent dehydrogenase (short-subunit alcohol dehydrogenase family)|nr:bifunctional aldolase/short-chain dehydrogenase [Pseudolabrys sp.]
MRSAWVDSDAKQAVDYWVKAGIGAELARRVYSTRLLGRDRKLVLHGGGNTSVKTRVRDLLGADTEVLCVKGSGWDMASIEPAGMPAVRLGALRGLRARTALPDEEMVRVQRAALIDPQAPNPSVETLLHAFLPHKFVDHTHATAILSLIDQADSEALCKETFGARLGFVPYIMPGFALAKKAAAVFEKNSAVEGLILDKHGIVTFGDDAREAYERMMEFVSLAEDRLRKKANAKFVSARLPGQIARATDIAPIIRGACTLRDAFGEGAHKRQIVDFRSSDLILNYVNGKDVTRYARAGLITPDHVIRTGPWPLIAPAPEAGRLDDFKSAVRLAARVFMDDYAAYFTRQKARANGARMHDPLPRVVLVPGLGLFGLGASAQEARIAADVAETAAEGISGAEAIGMFKSISETDMFDVEYWPLERAKLDQRKSLPLEGQVAVVTGAAGAIGAATARAFAQASAEIALFDIDAEAVAKNAKAIGGATLAIACDVTSTESVHYAFEQVVAAFGGVDIVVSNAGAAWHGKIGEVDEAALRASFELNFFAHQKVAQAAVNIMLKQGVGGCLLFNGSKQAVNPGPDFGPYGLPKAATLLLVRQYALDYGADGIRANAVNADRIRSGLLTPDFIAQRAKARGVSEKEYMTGNLLRREVTAEDVAQAFLHQALELKTTANVTTVDGGNIAAALR